MKLKSFLIVVKDIERAKKYYQDLFGMEVLADYDGNIILSDGLVLQEKRYWLSFIGKDILPKSNSCELYFEEENIDAFYEKLKTLYPQTEFVNLPMTHDWGQRVVRFYDLDGNLIEVGTPFSSAHDFDAADTEQTGTGIELTSTNFVTDIQKRLYQQKDADYAAFQSKLTPGIPPEKFMGVRLPLLRKFAKEVAKEPACESFLKSLPHTYYDENMLHALLISGKKDYEDILSSLDAFLPYVDNWAVCDSLSPKALGKHKTELLGKIKQWLKSSHTYTVRFAIDMLMTFYLDADFKPDYLKLPASVQSEEYYVKMMVAWFFATALAKQWESTVPYLETMKLDRWTHNKTIQKAIESYRITDEQKEYLKTLKRTKSEEK